MFTHAAANVAQRSRALEGLRWVGLHLLLTAVLGALAAIFWSRVSELPTYTVGADGYAPMSERGFVSVFSSDAWYVAIGVVLGVALGLLAWRWLRPLGWLVAVESAAAGALAGLVTWRVGELLGPGPFGPRLASASPGDSVPIALELHADVALVVWVMAAVTPILLLSSLGPDPEDAADPAVALPSRAGRSAGSAPSPASASSVGDRGMASVDHGDGVARLEPDR